MTNPHLGRPTVDPDGVPMSHLGFRLPRKTRKVFDDKCKELKLNQRETFEQLLKDAKWI